jgi:ribosomal-protein-alanine N-acetyltransferase
MRAGGAKLSITLETSRLIIASPQVAMAAAACDFVVRNHAHLAPWSPPAPPGVETPAFWAEYAHKTHDALKQGTLVRFWVVEKADPTRIIATFGFSQIFRAAFCSATLGYQIDAACEGKGLMHEALSVGIRYMFTEQKLHRIAANYMPHNVRSGRLLARLGFSIEGYAKEYLFIDGAWRDHVLTARVNPHFSTIMTTSQ